MTVEFTGERIIPGQVDVDLWNEHLARYAFAVRLARGRRVLDAGCGSGYGSAELAAVAHSVTGIDIAPEALDFASKNYSAANVRWTRASSSALPFRNGSYDLVVAFEVIEHLHDWPDLLKEARRVLAPGGQFIVSTPNKSFYAKTRELEGPNPFHTHEFDFGEFRDALHEVFPHVALFLEDHTEGVLFRTVQGSGAADVRVENSACDPAESSFFVAVCAMTHQTGSPTFVYIPRAANVLGEKMLHIERLEGEVATKTAWLDEAHQRHAQLVEEHRAQTSELEAANRWAETLDSKLKDALSRIAALQDELAAEQTVARESIARLESEIEERTRWAVDTEQRLTAQLQEVAADRDNQTQELVKCVEILHGTEAALEEQKRYSEKLQGECNRLRAVLDGVQASRWLKLGRAVGLGPELTRR
jgi:SAM-dependent methyltransferase